MAAEGSRESVDAGCRNLTAPWVRDRAQSCASVELCGYFEDMDSAGPAVRPAAARAPLQHTSRTWPPPPGRPVLLCQSRLPT